MCWKVEDCALHLGYGLLFIYPALVRLLLIMKSSSGHSLCHLSNCWSSWNSGLVDRRPCLQIFRHRQSFPTSFFEVHYVIRPSFNRR
jgi:hypothetical protein